MSRNLPILFICWLLLFGTSCQLTQQIGSLLTAKPGTLVETAVDAISEKMPTPGTAVATPTAEPLPGSSRALPLAPGQSILLPNWQIEILDHKRGDAAWDIIQDHSYNQPPAANEEYLLVEYSLTRTDNGTDAQSVSLGITGSALVLYHSFEAKVVLTTPYPETQLTGGQQSRGWAAYRIRADETDLIAVIDLYNTPASPDVYVALSNQAAIHTAVDALDSIRPTDIGQTIDNPVAWGETAVTRDWQVSLSQLIRGTDAWDLLLDTNQFNDPPADGMEYLLVYARVGYIGNDEDGQRIDYSDFSLLQADGSEYARPYLVLPAPALSYRLYPGGYREGWVLLQTAVDHTDPILQFNSDYAEATRNKRYFSLPVHGR